jgi:hypothetical protein
MKRTLPSEGHSKFSGNLRHYHRSSSQRQRTWDEWVDGPASKARPPRNWLKIIGFTLGVLALAGIIYGLIIVLR